MPRKDAGPLKNIEGAIAMSNREIFQEIENQLRAGSPVVEATVIQTKGSTPRGGRFVFKL